MTTGDDSRSAGDSTFEQALRDAAPSAPGHVLGSTGLSPAVGETLDGKYRLDGLVGGGGMGTVYRATHMGTGRAVALKVLVPELTANPAAVERFRREARTAGQMRHPNIVDVTDFGFAERPSGMLAYLVMELLRGKTLRAMLDAEGRLSVRATIDLLDQISSAVAVAHAQGVLHRDLKPENIHLEPLRRGYRVRVLDFGIAKLLHAGPGAAPDRGDNAVAVLAIDPALAATLPASEAVATTQPSGTGDASLTRLGAAIGTPRYMSPEQWKGQAVDERSDIYSLGVIAYEMLAGEPPFLGKERPIAIEHAELRPAPLAARAPSVPTRIVRVVDAALAKDPGARPPSAAAFAAALHAGSETTWGLIARSVALTVEHLGKFVRRCLILTFVQVPFVAVEIGASIAHRAGALNVGAYGAVSGVASVLQTVILLVLYAPVNGWLAPFVAELVASPGAPYRAVPMADLWRATRASLVGTFLTFAGILVGMAFLVALAALLASLRKMEYFVVVLALGLLLGSAVLAPFSVYPAVAAVEGLAGLAPLRRSISLVRPMLGAAFGAIVVWSIAVTLPSAVVLLIGGFTSPGVTMAMVDLVTIVSLVVGLLLGVLMMPFGMVPQALLYVRAREAEGRPLVPAPPEPAV